MLNQQEKDNAEYQYIEIVVSNEKKIVDDYLIGTKGYWMDKFDVLVLGRFWTIFEHIRPPVCMVNRYDELCFYCYKHQNKCRCAARHF